MKQNIQDVLGRGEKLDSVVNKSANLRDVSPPAAREHRLRPPLGRVRINRFQLVADRREALRRRGGAVPNVVPQRRLLRE